MGTVTGPTAGVDTTDLMAMATGYARSGPLMRRSPPAVPILTLRLTHTGGATGEGMAMVDTTGHTATGADTGARLLASSQYSGHRSFILSRNLDQSNSYVIVVALLALVAVLRDTQSVW